VSWIPPEAVEGLFQLPFELGVAHYDAPPLHPDGGRSHGSGCPASDPACPVLAHRSPDRLVHRHCRHRNRRVDRSRPPRREPFSRHYLYDPTGRLIQKTGLIRYKTWFRESEEHDTPWGGVDDPVPTVGVSSKAERTVADAALVSRA
jgi:hypothetical protein